MMKSNFLLHNSFAFWAYRLNNLLQERFNEQLKSFDITWPQWMILNVLDNGEGHTPAFVANQMGVDRSGVTRLLDRLEAKEYVVREHDRLDRRSVKLALSEKGKQAIGDINQQANQHQEAFLAELHISERRALKKELQKILKTCGVDTTTLWQRID